MLVAERLRVRKPLGTATGGGEAELWCRYRACPQDGTALSLLMEHYLPLVVQTVNRLSARFSHRCEPNDLLGAAILGLYSAIQRFADDHRVPFAVYARKRIAGAVLDDLRQRDPLSREQRSRLRRTRQTLQEFAQTHGRTPTDDELAAELQVSPEQVAETLALEYHTVSLHDEAEEGLTYQDILCDPNTPSPVETADRRSACEALRRALPKLDVREQQLLFFRHCEALSVAEIAAVFEVTPARVSQLYNGAIARLRALMKVDEAGAV